MQYIFVDESGDLGFTKKSSRFFVMAALITFDKNQLVHIIKNMRRRFFKKELSSIFEIKANHSSESMKRHMINKLNTLSDARALFLILDKRKASKTRSIHEIYKRMFSKLSELFESSQSIEIEIDRVFTKKIFERDFKKLFTISENSNAIKRVNQGLSHESAGLQFADLLAWVGFRKFEFKDAVLHDLLAIKKEDIEIKL
ncbi:MAG TPA: DUF3800 domain-containing protein [Candidatus Lokiarchaeia archaeon]|nr:DUF3800 domain-containing protein [Candidatus Lokiarchaeia archaeon]